MPDSQKDFHKKLLGRSGERKAARFLKRKGYRILDKNFATGIGEIDIIAKDGEYFVFVEVKTRKDDAFGRPSLAVTPQKQRKYRKIAMQYVFKKDLGEPPMRFDVIEIFDGELNHIENAF
ncbi:MAG: YraN family protein [Clostridia bacterium]|nr:YraN family protein [Clostridia bacterium]